MHCVGRAWAAIAFAVFTTVAGSSAATPASVEPHATVIVRDILATRDAVREASGGGAALLAFWDFDGTLLRGDCSEGFSSDGNIVYPGLAQVCIERGLSRQYPPDDGFARFWRDYRMLDERVGHWLAYPYIPQMLHGAKRDEVFALAREHFRTVLGAHYFAASMAMLRELERAGIENFVLSASADVFVDAAAETLALPVDRFHGIEVACDAEGRLTTELVPPVTWADGKVVKLLQIVASVTAARPGRPVCVLAAFGNSFGTDGPFLEYVARLPLPGGRSGTAVMINGGLAPPRYLGCFREIMQTATIDLCPAQ